MDSIQFADIDFSATNRSRKKTCSKCKSADHILPSCPLNPCGHCKLPGHISSSWNTRMTKEILPSSEMVY